MSEAPGPRVRFRPPGLYAIVDRATLEARGLGLRETVSELVEAGVELLQYRDKLATGLEIERSVAVVRDILHGSSCRLILNDDPDAARRTGCEGVHLGQGDAEPAVARAMMGANAVIGVSTHTEVQVRAADLSDADYLAIGPVFRTSTKPDAEPEVGLEGVRRARALTRKPLVAIGGITVERVAEVLDAGADSLAVVGSLYQPSRSVRENARVLIEAFNAYSDRCRALG